MEFEKYHLECIPGFSKYFIDLGYYIDIILNKNFSESMEKFKPKTKITIYEFENFSEVFLNKSELKEKLKHYKYTLLGTTKYHIVKAFKEIGYYNNQNALFIVHNVSQRYLLDINNSLSSNKAFTLLDNGIIPYLNPNYFGRFKISHQKQKKLTFFMTSTLSRSYTDFIKGALYLKNNSIDFEVKIIGHSNKFNETQIPEILKPNIHYFGKVSYQEMYKLVLSSDFIIINIYPNREGDYLFRTYLATGSAQLSYGFHKPVLIEESFAGIYKFSYETSIIYNGYDLSSAMLKASKINSKEYTKMSLKIEKLRKQIYQKSLNNLKNSLQN